MKQKVSMYFKCGFLKWGSGIKIHTDWDKSLSDLITAEAKLLQLSD